MATEDPYALRGIVDPAPYAPGPLVPWWAWLIGAIVAGLVVGAVIRARRRAGRPPALGALREAARRRVLAALDAVAGVQPAKALATEVSFALRRYLADCCQDPALFETHEEFIARADALAVLPADIRAQTANAFATLAAMKYAPVSSDAPPDLIELAQKLVQSIHGALQTRP